MGDHSKCRPTHVLNISCVHAAQYKMLLNKDAIYLVLEGCQPEIEKLQISQSNKNAFGNQSAEM